MTLDQLVRTKPTICYALLSGSGNIRDEHVPFIQDLNRLSFDLSHPFQYKIIVVHQASSACVAHNMAASAMLAHPEWEWLWIWADDMVPNGTAVAQLQAAFSNKWDIIAPAVRVWNSHISAPYIVSGKYKETKPTGEVMYEFPDFYQSPEPFEQDASGTGGLLVHRRVLTDPKLHLGPHKETCASIFQDIRDTTGERLHGHDLEFTWRAKTLGYRLLCVPQTLYGHIHKGVDINEICGYAVTFANECVAFNLKKHGIEPSPPPPTEPETEAKPKEEEKCAGA